MNSKPRHYLCAALLLGSVLVSAGRPQFLETVIPVGNTPTDVLWNPASNKVYTANNQSGSVTVIDGASNQVLTAVAVADYPVSLCWNSVNNKVYATCGDPGWLYVIDGVGDTVLRRVRARGWPSLMAYNATGNKLYVLCCDDQMVRVYDGSSDTLMAEVWFGDFNTPYTVLWHPVSNKVFCSTRCDSESDTVFVVDCTTDEVTERRPVGNQPYATCWNPVNGLVYVAARYAIYALNAAGDSVVAIVPGYAADVCAVSFPNKLYALGGGMLRAIDCGHHVLLDSFPVGGLALLCDTSRGKVYCTDYYQDAVHVLDARGDSLLGSIPLGQYPNAICWNPTNSRVYIADAMDDVVYVIRDTATGVAEPAAAAINLSSLIVASPNPFTGTVTIECDQLAPGAGVCIFSQDGRQVRRLAPGLTLPGSPTTSTWDGKDELGRCVPRGVYLAVVEGHAGVRAKLVKLD